MANKRKEKMTDPKDQTPEYLLNLKRGWSLVVYDLQGGPIPARAVDKLNSFAEEIAKEYDLAITSTVE